VQAWLNPSLTVTVSSSTVQETSQDALGGNPYNQFSPGMIVQFAIFGLVQAAMVLVVERRCGAMQRLLTTPLTRAGLIAGHILAIFTIVFCQQLLLVGFGQVFLNVNYLRQPLAILLMIVSLSLFIASLGLLIATLAKKEEQVVVMTMAAMFLFSALGGTWFSLEVAGPTFAAVGHLTPAAWAMDGFQNIILRGLDFGSVLAPAGVLLAYALAFFGLAVWRFKFE
jgi:ABC-2 type transport system permease protein